jgi:hypothetical protein
MLLTIDPILFFLFAFWLVFLTSLLVFIGI